MRRWIRSGAALLVAGGLGLAPGLVSGASHAQTEGPSSPPATAGPAAPAVAEAAVRSLEERIIAASERVKPSVVHIEAIIKVNDRRSPVTGSGLLVSADGLVLTNHHVVDRAEKVEVAIPGHRQRRPARILGTDKPTDLALLRVDAPEPLPAADFARTAEVRVGQWVLAIGNPYGLDGTVSLGIVSAKGRNLEIPDLLNDFIQTDAMIDRGSSGGPLVDLEGHVVGLNSRGQGRGIGFTIPADTVRDVMRQILEGGVERGWLGVSIQPLGRDLADYLGLPDATGVVVNGVSEGSPAEAAGLCAGDVVTHLGGEPVEAEEEEDLARFQRRVAAFPPGRRVELTLLREGERRRVPVTLAAQPTVDPAEAETDLGFHVQELTEGLVRDERLATRRGAYVSFVARGSPAAEAGLFPGDVVVRVDEWPVQDLAGFREAMEKAGARERVLLHVRRGSDVKFLLVQRSSAPTEPPAPARTLESD
jgi:serine protease Do